MSFTLHPGFPQDQCAEMARLYWRVFGGKLGRVMGPECRAMDYITRVMRPDHAISAIRADGEVLGVAGFKTPEGAFVGGTFADLAAIYGRIGAVWRAGFLAILEREVENRCFVMDGIFVRDDSRGQGVGTALLDAICDEARRRGYDEVRLDVIGENIRARALYERMGFVARETSVSQVTAVLFGFRTATKMTKRL